MLELNSIKNTLVNTLRDNIAELSVPEYAVEFTEDNIAFENIVYNSKNRSVSYVQPIFMPNRGNMATLGVAGYDYEQGLFQINIRTPLGKGNAILWTVADHIGKVFHKGQKFFVDAGNFYVILRNAYASAALTDEAWHWCPVTIDWYAHICREPI